MIDLQDVGVNYPGHAQALSGVTLHVDKGEFLSIVGPTGAGKTTLLRLLYRGETSTTGTVTVAGQNLNLIRPHDIPFFRRKLGIVFQDFGLLPNQTAYENVAYALRVIGATGATIRRQVPAALDMVGMAHRPDAYPAQLSGGEQQRVAIARAIVHDPVLLLADEPTGNLDPDTSIGIMELLLHINVRGTTVISATHDAVVVDRTRRRVVALDKGEIVRDEEEGLYKEALPADPEPAAP
jgi:cell division transport system ATP-binding protein